jgi:hypothetical protein
LSQGGDTGRFGGIEKVRYADIPDVTAADINAYAAIGNKA